MSEINVECDAKSLKNLENEINQEQSAKLDGNGNDLRQLKRARSTAKGILSKRQNELTDIFSKTDNSSELEKKLSEMHKALEKFRTAHDAFHDNLQDEDDILESNDYYEAVIERFSDLKERATQKLCLWKQDNVELDIRPEDSVSNAGSRAGSESQVTSMSKLSKRSSNSSVSVSRARASAKKAILEAQSASLAKRQALQEEQLRLQQKADQLDLETELAKAQAEERAYLEADKKSDVSFSKRDKSETSSFSKQVPLLKSTINSNRKHYTTAFQKQSNDTYTEKVSVTHPSTLEAKIPQDHPVPPHLHLQKRNENVLSFPGADKETKNLETNRGATASPIEQLLLQQQRHTLALMLPQPEIPTFDGDPIEFQNFIRAFETLIELKTDSDSARLYYLVQYTAGDARELMKSCLSMNGPDGYVEARKALKQKYGQKYKIASAYVDRVTNGPSIKSEDANSLQKFSILLTSCKNALKDIGYLSKIENPESLRKIVNRLPYALRRKWRDVADNITENQEREITIDDISTFVAKVARAAAHPIFGDLNGDSKELKGRDEQNHLRRRGENKPRSNFAVDGKQNSADQYARPTIKCPQCDANHWLSQCTQFRTMSLIDRFNLVRKRGLCDNCLTRGHLARNCPKKSFCKVQDCKEVHSTFLHESSSDKKLTRPKGNENEEPDKDNTESKSETKAQSGYIKSAKHQSKTTSNNSTTIGLAIVPVKVRAAGSERIVQTYAFLDGGSNTSFCSENLMRQLNIEGKRTNLTLTTLGKANSKTESSIVSLELSDLQDENHVSLKTVFSTPVLPVTTRNRASQQDIRQWPHLSNI
ncbi:PREDICTED: uncharacterized protein LOC107342904, partial [Paramuricea clavata]